MIVDPTLSGALRHWGARAVPFSDSPGEAPFAHASWEQARLLLQQTAALRSLMLLSSDNGIGKSALVGHWIQNPPTATSVTPLLLAISPSCVRSRFSSLNPKEADPSQNALCRTGCGETIVTPLL